MSGNLDELDDEPGLTSDQEIREQVARQTGVNESDVQVDQDIEGFKPSVDEDALREQVAEEFLSDLPDDYSRTDISVSKTGEGGYSASVKQSAINRERREARQQAQADAFEALQRQTDTDLDRSDVVQEDDGSFRLTREAAAEEFTADTGELVFEKDIRETADGFTVSKRAQRRIAALQTGFSMSDLEETQTGGFEVSRDALAERVDRQTRTDVDTDDIMVSESGDVQLTEDAQAAEREAAKDEAVRNLFEQFEESTGLEDYSFSRDDVEVVQRGGGYAAGFEEGVLERELRQDLTDESDRFDPDDVVLSENDGQVSGRISEAALSRERTEAIGEARADAIETFLENNPGYSRDDVTTELDDGRIFVEPTNQALARKRGEQRELAASMLGAITGQQVGTFDLERTDTGFRVADEALEQPTARTRAQQAQTAGVDERELAVQLSRMDAPFPADTGAAKTAALTRSDLTSDGGFRLTAGETRRRQPVYASDLRTDSGIRLTAGETRGGPLTELERARYRKPTVLAGFGQIGADTERALRTSGARIERDVVDPLADYTGEAARITGDVLGQTAAVSGPVAPMVGKRVAGPTGKAFGTVLSQSEPDPAGELGSRVTEPIGRGVGRGAGALVNLPKTALETAGAAQFIAEGVGETVAGRGGQIVQGDVLSGDATLLEGGFAEERVEPAARTRIQAAADAPLQTFGQLAGGLALSGGAIGAAYRFGGPLTGRAVSTVIQPGEEAAIFAARRGLVSGRAASAVPGVRRSMFEGTEERAQADLTGLFARSESESETESDFDEFDINNQEIAGTEPTPRPSPRQTRRIRDRPRPISEQSLQRLRRQAGEFPTRTTPATDLRVESALQPESVGFDTRLASAIGRNRLRQVEATSAVDQEIGVAGAVPKDPLATRTRSFVDTESRITNLEREAVESDLQSEIASEIDRVRNRADIGLSVESGVESRLASEVGVESLLDTATESRVESRAESALREDLRVELGLEVNTESGVESSLESRVEPTNEVERQERRFEFGIELSTEPRREADFGGGERRDDDTGPIRGGSRPGRGADADPIGTGYFNEFVQAYALGAGIRDAPTQGELEGAGEFASLTEQRPTATMLSGTEAEREEIAEAEAFLTFGNLGDDDDGGLL